MYFLKSDVEAHQGAVRALDVGQTHIASGGLDGILKVWQADVPNSKPTIEIKDHKKPIYSIKLGTDTIFSGSQDGTLLEHDVKSGRCVNKFAGHLQSVNSLDVVGGDNNTHLVSGSWDSTARVWMRTTATCVKQFGGHAHAVAVCGLPDGSHIVTGSQNKALNVYDISSGRLVSQIENAHDDIIRHISVVLHRPELIVTCSNAGDVKVWNVGGNGAGPSAATSATTSAATATVTISPVPIDGRVDRGWCPTESFLFDARGFCVSESIYLIAGADDGTCLLGQFTATAAGLVKKSETHVWPHTSSVWQVCLRGGSPMPEIVTACGDGRIRVFTPNRTDAMPEIEALKRREEALNTIRAQKAQQSAGAVDWSKLPKAADRRTVRGRIAGQTKLFLSEDGTMVEVYQWTGSEWQKVGDMVQPEEGIVAGNKIYEGDDFFAAGMYDFVWDVQIETKPGHMPRLPFRLTDNPMEVAERFCAREQISKINIPDILNFIKANSQQDISHPPVTTPASPVADPASPMLPPTASSTSPARDPTSALANMLPITFPAGTSWEKAIEKIRELSQQQPAALQLEMRDVICLDSLHECMKKAVFDRTEIKQGDLHFLFGSESKWRQWEPKSQLFPFFDMWRKLASHNASADYFRRSGRGQDQVTFAFDTLDTVTLLDGGATSLCICRYLANISQWSSTKGWFFDHADYMVSRLRQVWPHALNTDTPIKKNTVNAVFAFLLNLSLAAQSSVRSLGASSQSQRDEMQVKIDQLSCLLMDLSEKVEDVACVSTGVSAIGILRLSQVPNTVVGDAGKDAAARALSRVKSLGLNDKIISETVSVLSTV